MWIKSICFIILCSEDDFKFCGNCVLTFGHIWCLLSFVLSLSLLEASRCDINHQSTYSAVCPMLSPTFIFCHLHFSIFPSKIHIIYHFIRTDSNLLMVSLSLIRSCSPCNQSYAYMDLDVKDVQRSLL